MRTVFKSVFAAAALLLIPTVANAQCTGQFLKGTFCGYNGPSTSGLPGPVSIAAGSITLPGGTVLGNRTTGTTTATGLTNPILGIPGTSTGQIGFAGITSGTVTIIPQSVAGTPTLTLPNTSGTFAVNASAPLVLSLTTGQLTLPGLAGGVLAGSGPAFTITPVLGVPTSSQGTLGFAGLTSGTATITALAIAGTPTLTLPNTSGTFAVNATGPLVLNATTGGLTCPTCATTTNGGALTATLPVAISAAGVISIPSTTGTGSTVVLQTSPNLVTPNIDAATGTSLALGGATLGTNNLAINGTETITSASSQALSVGANGQTNPALSVNTSTASSVTGIQIASSSLGGGAAILTLSTGTNETLNINAKGSGVISLGGASTGNVIAGIGGGQLVSTNDFVATTGVLRSTATFQLLNGAAAQGLMVNCLLVAGTYTSCPAAGVVNVATGFQIGGAAATANYLRGNGTNFVAAAAATLANYTSGSGGAAIEPSIIYTAETTTTFGATTAFDFSTFINTAVTLTGNITTMNVSNVKAGQAGTITFIQDGTGSRTTVWNTVFKFASGAQPLLTTTANAVDVLTYSCRSATFCAASLLKQVQ